MLLDKYLLKTMIERRAGLEERTRKAVITLVVPEEVVLEENIPYSSVHSYDMFLPKDQNRKYPAIINVHGGGLFMGLKEQNRAFCLNMAKEGNIVFAMDYSLVPENNAFQILEEIRESFEAIYQKLQTIECFNGEIFAVGDSAGAFLLYQTLAIKGNHASSEALNVKPISFDIQAAAFQNGMFYSARRDKVGLLSGFFFGKNYRRKDFYPYLNPEKKEVIEALPPFFFFTTENDYLRAQSVDFAKVVSSVRTDYEFHDYNYPTMEHAYACLHPEMEECRLVNRDMMAFFRHHQTA